MSFDLLPTNTHPLDFPLGRPTQSTLSNPFGFKPRQRIVFAVMIRQPNGQIQKFLFANWGQAMALYRKALKAGLQANKPVRVIV